MKDITDDQTGSIQACLCETELCNNDHDVELQSQGEILSEENDREESGVESLLTTTKRSLLTTLPILGEIVKKSEIINTALDIEETPRTGTGFKVSLDTSQSLEDDLAEAEGGEEEEEGGVRCYSCGSLLSPDQSCPTFDPQSREQIARCGPGEACLLYTWARSHARSATIRHSLQHSRYQLCSQRIFFFLSFIFFLRKFIAPLL